MNRIKSKENLNPNNLKAKLKVQQQHGVKTRNQSRPLFKENPNNPQKSTLKHNLKKKDEPKHQKETVKRQKKIEHLPAELYYQQEIISLITQQATKKFKRYKQLEQNNLYKAYRQSLIESIYRECQQFELKAQTFYLYVYFLDTFMKTEAARRLSLENSILVSYACFLMAQKYQEIYPPSIQEWLPAHLHEKVYRWEGKIIFALNFQFVNESLYHFFSLWSKKYQLRKDQIQNCQIVLESIVFNYDLMYRYEPQKIAKALILMELDDKRKKFKNFYSHDFFESVHEKNNIVDEIRKHIMHSTQRILWIGCLKK